MQRSPPGWTITSIDRVRLESVFRVTDQVLPSPSVYPERLPFSHANCVVSPSGLVTAVTWRLKLCVSVVTLLSGSVIFVVFQSSQLNVVVWP